MNDDGGYTRQNKKRFCIHGSVFCIFLLFYNLVMLLIRGGMTEEGYVVSVKGIVIVTIPCCKGNDNICIITCFSFHFRPLKLVKNW